MPMIFFFLFISVAQTFNIFYFILKERRSWGFKYIKENISAKLLDYGPGDGFVNLTPKARKQRRKSTNGTTSNRKSSAWQRKPSAK